MTRRNNLIDMVRLLMAFLVVFIHTGQNSFLKEIFLPVASCAVPFFFSVTGYYLKGKSEKSLLKQIKKLTFIFIVWMLFAALWDVFWVLRDSGTAGLLKYFSHYVQSAIKMLVFNVPMIGSADHLWYLLAVIYVLLVDLALRKIKIAPGGWHRRIVMIILFVTALLMGHYSFVWNGAPHYMYTRNWLLTAMPFYLLGQEIAEQGFVFKKISGRVLSIMTFLSAVLLCVEYAFLSWLHSCRGEDNLYNLYIFTIVTAILLWAVLCRYGCNVHDNIAAELGRDLSLYIYLLHPFIRCFTDKFFELLPSVDWIYSGLRPEIVFVVSLFAAVLIFNLKKMNIVRGKNEKAGKNKEC